MIIPDALFAERFRIASKEAAKRRGEAKRKKFMADKLYSQMVSRSNLSVAKAEHMATASDEYERAKTEAINAETMADIQDAEAEAIKMHFEEWRSANANQRAEMKL